MGLFEVAEAAGVSAQAVSNWRARGVLPKPRATLASGPVWEGRTIDAWLRSSGRMAAMTDRASAARLKRGAEYTHAEVVARLGGEPQSYLPQVHGRIVGARFKTDKTNPNAPERVIVGNLPRVTRKAELLAAQGGAIPVFLKEATNRWIYRGEMRCIAFDRRDRVIDSEPGAEDRAERPAGILVMEDAR